MGLDRIIHLEPFIKIEKRYKSYDVERHTCGVHNCKKYDKFCSVCGNAVTKQFIPIQCNLNCDELIDNENFYDYFEGEMMYIFSNIKSNFEINISENKFTTLTPALINSMIEDFKKRHKRDIEILEEKISKKVYVEFGFVYEVR